MVIDVRSWRVLPYSTNKPSRCGSRLDNKAASQIAFADYDEGCYTVPSARSLIEFVKYCTADPDGS